VAAGAEASTPYPKVLPGPQRQDDRGTQARTRVV